MSEAIGPVAIGKKEESIFLGREFHQGRDLSQKTAELVDSEIHNFITVNYDRGVEILRTNIDILHRMAQALLERESLDREEIEMIIQGKVLPPYVAPEDPTYRPVVVPTPTEKTEPQLAPLGKPKTEVA